jgi:hypothetical protein
VTQTSVQERLHTAAGASEADDAIQAGRAAAEEAIAGLAGRHADLVIVYASVRYDLTALLGAIREVTGDTPVVGATSNGHFCGASLTEPARGVALLALTSGPYRFGIASVGELSTDAEAAGARLARSARSAVGPDRSRHATMLLLADGLAPEHQALITGIHRVTGTAVPVVGGCAADDRRLSQTFVFHDDRVLTDAAVAVWIDSAQPVPVRAGHGWHPIGLPLLVTSVDGQVVHEIAGRPARDVFEEHIRRGHGDEFDRVRPGGYYSLHAFGLIEPDGSHLIRGVFMDNEGNIRTFAPLPVYSAIQIVSCDQEETLAMSRQIAEEAVTGRDPSLLLIFSCVARLDVLQDRGSEEAQVLQDAAGTVPVFGIYTYGEFARTSTVAGYHNSTVTAVAL